MKVFDRAGLAAFEQDVRAHFDNECAALSGQKRPAVPNPNYARDHWCRILKAVLLAATERREVYRADRATELTQADCEAIAAARLTTRQRRRPGSNSAATGAQPQKPRTRQSSGK